MFELSQAPSLMVNAVRPWQKKKYVSDTFGKKAKCYAIFLFIFLFLKMSYKSYAIF